MQFLPIRTPIAPRVHAVQLPAGRVISLHNGVASFRRKLVGRNCMDAISTRFPGFRLSPPLPNGNAFRALPIGARRVGKQAKKSTEVLATVLGTFYIGRSFKRLPLPLLGAPFYEDVILLHLFYCRFWRCLLSGLFIVIIVVRA